MILSNYSIKNKWYFYSMQILILLLRINVSFVWPHLTSGCTWVFV